MTGLIRKLHLKEAEGLFQQLVSLSHIFLSCSSSSVLLEHEITLDGTIVSAAFDDSLEMGIVGTTAGTLWYINWMESTSIRLISGHKNKVGGAGLEWFVLPSSEHCVCCPCPGKRVQAAEAFPGLATGELRELQGSLVLTG